MVKSVPLILQMENSECGAASLSMILRYFGRNISLEQMRVDCGVSRNGVTAKGIVAAAKKYDLKCQAYKAEPEGLKKLPMPAIIHWNMDHFVVLRGHRFNYWYLNDPAVGKIRISDREFSRNFTGIILTFEKGENFRSEHNTNKVGFTAFTLRKCLFEIMFVSFVYMIISAFSMMLPMFNSVYIDDFILSGDNDNFSIFITAILSVVILSLIGSILCRWLSEYEERRINALLSTGFMEKIFTLPMNFFNQRTAGELTNRQLGSFEAARLVCNYLMPYIFQVLLVILYLSAAFFLNVYIAFIGVIAIIANIIISLYSSRMIGGITAVEEKNKGLYQSSLSSAAEMIDTIKSCACENTMFSVLSGSAALSLDTKERADHINVIASSLFQTVNLFVLSSMMIMGIFEILNGSFYIGQAIGMIGLTTAFFVPVGTFINSIPTLFQLKNIAVRTDDTMYYAEENIFLDSEKEQVKETDGSITAENVYFSYIPGLSVVKNLNFKLEKGKSIAFTGSSGSGKSTAIKLIAGLYGESTGNIFYGNAKKSELSRDYFYSKIAVVNQSVKLYEGTVFDNITMWDKTIGYDEVVDACIKACINDDITARKDAYYEIISENGKNFSGGQIQRFEIARAILKKPEILILDEATSALDVAVEKEIMRNIRSMGITLVIAAHRLSTIKECDEILLFEDGEVKERGTYRELLDKNGAFRKLIKSEGE